MRNLVYFLASCVQGTKGCAAVVIDIISGIIERFKFGVIQHAVFSPQESYMIVS